MIDDWAIVSISILFYTRINVNCKYKNGNGEIQFIVREIGGYFVKKFRKFVVLRQLFDK